jgi:peptide/nickel transport system permease protein
MDPTVRIEELPASAAGVGEPDIASSDFEVSLKSLNQWQIAWRRFRRHRLAMFGAFLFLAIVAVVIVLPFFFPFDFYQVPTPVAHCPGAPTSLASSGCPPSLAHPFGTTGGLQRDVFTVVVNGGRLSLVIGIGASLIAALIGATVGGVAGYFGGWVDNVLMRIVDVLLTLPILFVILVASKFLGGGSWVSIIAVFALLGWPVLARLVRSLFLTLRSEVFVEAARAVGVGHGRIIFRHILPNALSPLIVATTLSIAGVIVTEAFVSFLGFGVDVTQPTWGNALTGAVRFIQLGNWWWPLFPGMAIVLTVLGINFMGDGLRDALDPRSKY